VGEYQLGASEAQAVEAMRQALQIEVFPIDPPGWLAASQMAAEWGMCAGTVRGIMRGKVADGLAEEITAIMTINGRRSKTRVYRPKNQ